MDRALLRPASTEEVSNTSTGRRTPEPDTGKIDRSLVNKKGAGSENANPYPTGNARSTAARAANPDAKKSALLAAVAGISLEQAEDLLRHHSNSFCAAKKVGALGVGDAGVADSQAGSKAAINLSVRRPRLSVCVCVCYSGRCV